MAMLQTLARKSKSLVRMDGPRRGMMVEALLFLGVASVATAFLPFRKVATRMGKVMPPAQGEARMAGVTYAPDAAAIARDVGWAVQRTANYVPFKAVCLQQALAGQWMLRRRGVISRLHLGVATRAEEGRMKAHAWLDAAEVRVTGYPVDPDYVEVAVFI